MRFVSVVAGGLAILSILVASEVTAATINVNPDGSGDFTTIQAAVDTAVGGDTVAVAPGVYVENVVLTGANIILTSSDPNLYPLNPYDSYARNFALECHILSLQAVFC